MTDKAIKFHLEAALDAGIARSCTNKIDYKSESSAIRAAESMNKKTGREGYHLLEAYPCPFCNGWHIGRVIEFKDD